jgi:serine/threonine protein kinase
VSGWQVPSKVRLGMSKAEPNDISIEEELMGDELAPGTKLSQENYTIVEHLKSGGFGITYLALDTLGRKVVIKECFPSGMCTRPSRAVRPRSRAYTANVSNLIDKFVAEAHSLAKVSHPNIVNVHQIFKENDTAYMALDYVEGKDLLEVMEDPTTALTPADVRSILLKLLDAIGLVHEKGLLHRDISPDNILIDLKRNPVLIDFGAAREQEPSPDRAASTLHVVKDGYSPQELYISGGDQGPWSDLYSLAASFYHVIAKEAPPNSQARLSALATQSEDPCVPLVGRIAGYDKTFLAAIDKAMSVLPKERMQSAQQWVSMISDAEGGKVLRLPMAEPARSRPLQSRVATLEVDTTRKPMNPMALVGGIAAIAMVAGGVYFAMPKTETADVTRVTAGSAATEAAPEAPTVGPTEAAPPTADPAPEATAPTPTETAEVAPEPAVEEPAAVAEPAAEPTVAEPTVAEPTAPVEVALVATEWTVELPFAPADGRPTEIGNTTGPVPDWVAPGVQIVAIGGTEIKSIDDIAGILQQSADPGVAASVAVTLTTVPAEGAEPVDQSIELAIVHEVALKTGTKFRARSVNGAWLTEVMALPSGYEGDLRVGDLVVGDVNTGAKLEGPTALADLIQAAIAAGADTTTLAVQRGGQMWVVPVLLPK